VLLPVDYLNSVVAIGTDGDDGSRQWVGSGVLYAKRTDDGRFLHCLVTNKHVIDPLASAYVRLNPRADGPAIEAALGLRGDDGSPFWYAHPDPAVDLAVTPVVIEYLEQHSLDTYFLDTGEAMTREQMRERHVSEGDALFVLGFPMGIVGDERSRVIARAGCLARVQDALSGARNTFLIDSAVYPGNSGGAVILSPQTTSVHPEAPPIGEAMLIGIVAAYVPYTDVAISVQTQRPRIAFEENSGLAEVYPVDFIEESIDLIPTESENEQAAPIAPIDPAQIEGEATNRAARLLHDAGN
jgi:hypothetical protein